MSSWKDKDEKNIVVSDRYEHNKMLIDLSCQPDEIKLNIAETIASVYSEKKKVKNILLHFMKFTKKYELVYLTNNYKELLVLLNKPL